jgi:hypothetical protein
MDLNFTIPELVTGVQFSKGPYYAEQAASQKPTDRAAPHAAEVLCLYTLPH